MLRIVSLQVSMMVIVMSIAAALGGVHAAVSAGLGGLACTLPNGLFALRLAMQARRPGGAGVESFFVGEFVKLALTVVLLFAIATQYRDLNWLALLAGFVAALKSYFVAFLFDRHTYGN